MDDAEEQVLTRWDKIKKWFEIVMATKKLAMFIWSLVFGLGGAVVVGEVTDTRPLRDAAVEIGLLRPVAAPVAGSATIPEHTHEHTHTLPNHAHDHTHPAGAHIHQELIDFPEGHSASH